MSLSVPSQSSTSGFTETVTGVQELQSGVENAQRDCLIQVFQLPTLNPLSSTFPVRNIYNEEICI